MNNTETKTETIIKSSRNLNPYGLIPQNEAADRITCSDATRSAAKIGCLKDGLYLSEYPLNLDFLPTPITDETEIHNAMVDVCAGKYDYFDYIIVESF